jgi:hypothetical protein
MESGSGAQKNSNSLLLADNDNYIILNLHYAPAFGDWRNVLNVFECAECV